MNWRRRGPIRLSVVRHRCDWWKLALGSFAAFTAFGWTWWWVINKALGR